VLNETDITAAGQEGILIQGAREHNLKNLTVTIPRGKFVVLTGVSGSGKSTLAFDILFAEGQRRFLDSMNAYARQFVEQLSRPDVDLIAGIPPTVSIEQRNSSGGGKSTVATVTEIYHFIRLLFARLGTQYCPDCQIPVEAQTRDELGARLQEQMKQRGDLLLLAPVVRNRKGFHTEVAEWAAKHGYAEIRADGKIYSTSERLRLDRFKEHDVEIVIGVMEKKPRAKQTGKTAQQVVDEALNIGKGTLLALDNHGVTTVHSTARSCSGCGKSFEILDPKFFSYNSSRGWCPTCRGFGETFYLPDAERGARADAIEESWFGWQEGKREICPECKGARLNPLARAVRLIFDGLPAKSSKAKSAKKLPGQTIDDIGAMSVWQAAEYFNGLQVSGRDAEVARDILPEIRERMRFLNEVGLGYLQLSRSVTTLSGGESQRIRLAAQLGSNLSGVLYILDEPTIGLHARDNEQLLDALQKLRSRGNSLVVVEHDEDTMRRADYIIDLGPGAGVKGGQVIAHGTLAELLKHKDSLTGKSLAHLETKKYPTRGERRPVTAPKKAPSKKTKKAVADVDSTETQWLTLRGASTNNLKDVTLEIPLGRFVVVTGVSGSGKSTLVRECLLPALEGSVGRKGKKNENLTGAELLSAVHEVNQAPIGRTPRSTPATYVGFFDDIRTLFSNLPESKLRGYSSSRFSFNSNQGRCPVCEGAGTIKLEMNFLPPAYVKCESCNGSRFNRETLDIEYAGKNIAQVLDLSVAEGIEFFTALQKIKRPLEALRDTGLDYLRLGQTSPTLSGGEAQRVKLVTHLLTGLKNEQPDLRSIRPLNTKPAIFILEEPTIGLHMTDVQKLVEVIQRLVEAGNTVVVIEHNLDLIAEADWVIDLGPEGGAGGGEIIAAGTPEAVAKVKGSHTGRFLKALVEKK
jgi:excinuclease ABC subunit A